MSKQMTHLALMLALAIAAGGQTATAASMGDVYSEAIWDIHVAAPIGVANSGKLSSPDLYQEAAWDADGGDGADRLAGRLAEAQEASRPDSAAIKLDTIE